MTAPSLDALIAEVLTKWKRAAEANAHAAREHNHANRPTMDAYCDGKAMALKDCIYDLESLLPPLAARETQIREEMSVDIQGNCDDNKPMKGKFRFRV